MDPKDKSILSEDGRRFIIEEDEITGNESTGSGLGYVVDNPEDNVADSKKFAEDNKKEEQQK